MPFKNNVEVKQFVFVTPENSPGMGEKIGDSADPTIVAKITFDCLKLGDSICLNSIFHVTNNTTPASNVIIDHSIIKNNVPMPIYAAETEIGRTTGTNIGQIFSQQYVDVINNLERNVTYQVVVSVQPIMGSTPDVSLLGPITFTGTQLSERKNGIR
ncbi:hypothetical protein VQL36_13320 [Chengkuizengella sp. SCS-71B]|uniref:hypothetical protein n=1 Tax=Chengkuizengella sp. SCS-71B TaxID=3115290 RepID=UPI0032C227F3